MEQIQKASRIIDMLFTKYEETQDLIATISYANKLQEGREVNNMVLRWALEAFIVHSDDAKRAGIRWVGCSYRISIAFMSEKNHVKWTSSYFI